ncbi:MAG: hypothetical protein HYT85_12225 [candidate division NC10 bacterium]|nr:hypothetical protein [candidate division NC10 bacterium]
MARIATVSVDRAEGLQLQLLQKSKSLYGGVLPGIRQILLFDPDLAVPASQMYMASSAGRPDWAFTWRPCAA